MTSKAVSGGSTTAYGYNPQNRLARVTIGTNPSISYRYNPDGFRLSKQIGASAANNYVVDPFNSTGYAQVLEDDGAKFVIGGDIIAQDTADGVAYFIYDGQGSVRYLADASGSLISGQTFDFDAYGNRTDTSEEQTNLLYTGEWHDSDLGWNYNRDRWSIPSLGIFNQPDKYMASSDDPQCLHKYIYCLGNPTNLIDPSGLFTQQFGYLAEAAIEDVYKIDHQDDRVLCGGWTRFGSPLDRVFRLKPDILNFSKSRWLEIKPLTVSGAAKASTQFALYSIALRPFGYKPDVEWTPSTHFAFAGTQEIFFFNAGGIVFYTDSYDAAEDLLALSSFEAVKLFLQSPAGIRLSRSFFGGLSRVPQLVRARVKADDSRFKGHMQISYLLLPLGAP